MKKILLYSSFFLFFITLFSFVSRKNGNDLVRDVLSATNEFRRSRSKPALELNEDLNYIARKHSENMARHKVAFGHSGFDKRYQEARKKIDGFSSFGENVAYGVSTGREVVQMWKESPPHRKNMLGNYRYVGIGVARDRNGRIYYTEVFAR